MNTEMKGLIQAFSANLEEALRIAERQTFKKPAHAIQNVVICGMGGSGIGGVIVSQWIQNDLKVPVSFCQDYLLPNYVNENTLVIASSYSGNTEETITSVTAAIQVKAHIIGISSGGKLEELCNLNGFDCVIVPGGNPPRTALAYSLVQLLKLFGALGMSDMVHLKSIESARQLLNDETDFIHTEAKRLAEELIGRVPVIYSVDRYAGIAVRATQQFNENAKMLCISHTIPEMNHNELVGWGGGDNRFAAVFFDSNDLIPQNRKRVEISLAHIAKKTDRVITVLAKGNDCIEKSLFLINIIDWASYYSAEIQRIDAIEIDIINYLKEEMGKL